MGDDRGGQKYGGRKTYQTTLSTRIFRPLQKSFWGAQSWISVQENRATTPEGGGKCTRRRRVQNPFLGGLLFVRFFSPLISPMPPIPSSENRPSTQRSFSCCSRRMLKGSECSARMRSANGNFYRRTLLGEGELLSRG